MVTREKLYSNFPSFRRTCNEWIQKYIVRQILSEYMKLVMYTSFLFSDFEVSGFYCDTRFWRSICHNPSAFASFCHLSPSWGSLYCVVSKVGSRRASKVQGKLNQVFFKLAQCTTYFDLTAKKYFKVRQQLYILFFSLFCWGDRSQNFAVSLL